MKRLNMVAAVFIAVALVFGFAGCKPTPVNYTVTFDADGGTPAPESQKVQEGKKATKPADPAKTGYSFDGWYNGDAAYDFEAPVNAEVNLKAKWTPLNYTIAFDTDGAIETPDAQTVAYGGKVTKPANPEKEGQAFKGWYVDDVEFDFTTEITKSLTITAKYYWGSKVPSAGKAVGDILFNDGSTTPYADSLTFTDDQKGAAVAVLFYVVTEETTSSNAILGTKTLGVGLHNDSKRIWAPENTDGYNTMFENIRCTNTQRIPENYGTVYSYSFYSHLGTESWSLVGDADGSDNWSEICDQDSEGSADPETNYPVFDYANNYGVNNNLPGDLANGWYLPSAIELMKIDENFSSVIGAIKKAGGTFIEGSSSEYWASNQNQCFKNNGEEEYHEICIKQAVSVCFGNAKSPNYDYKESSKYVCAIREF